MFADNNVSITDKITYFDETTQRKSMKGALLSVNEALKNENNKKNSLVKEAAMLCFVF